MEPGKSRNMPLQELLAARRPMPTSQKLTMTRSARGPAPAGATWRPGAGLGVSRCAHRASDTGMEPCHRPQAGARDPRRAARPTVHRPGHRRRTPRRRAPRARLDPQLRAGAADARPPDRDLPPTQHHLCQWQPKTAHLWQPKTAHFWGGRLGRSGHSPGDARREAAEPAVTWRLPHAVRPTLSSASADAPASGSCCPGC